MQEKVICSCCHGTGLDPYQFEDETEKRHRQRAVMPLLGMLAIVGRSYPIAVDSTTTVIRASATADAEVEDGMKNVGFHWYRFRINPEERRFAEAWDDFDQSTSISGSPSNLDYLLDSEQESNPEPTDTRSRTVAATVIQWLGSPVGQHFLKSLGYERKI